MNQGPSAAHPRSLSILGATGSVGRSTLALVAEAPELYRVEAVTAGRNATRLAAIAREVRAGMAVVADPACYGELKDALSGSGIAVGSGDDAMVEAASRPADLVVAAVVGSTGLRPVMAAVRRGAMLAFANKECLVCAGDLLLREVEQAGAVLLPIDSEHNAIFQALAGASIGDVERLVLTASGGPFRETPRSEMALMTPEQAIRHPKWSMGAKISIDSATMMNKGLEIIEAHYLFGVPDARIDVLIHPQSIVHSLVAFKDGSTLAQLAAPDMRVPIAYALGWPARITSQAPRLDLAACGRLDFHAPDLERFPALNLARHALRQGGAAPTILNAANEVAVAAFMERRIGFLDIVAVVAQTLEQPFPAALGSIDDVLACDGEARAVANRSISRLAGPAATARQRASV